MRLGSACAARGVGQWSFSPLAGHVELLVNGSHVDVDQVLDVFGFAQLLVINLVAPLVLAQQRVSEEFVLASSQLHRHT